MHRKIRIADLNEQLICKLCKGYFVDATTIIECLHSFCRSCIVSYLEKNKYCPTCDVQVHKTKPLFNVRPDKTLQDIVYKLVPRLLQDEIQRRKKFNVEHPEVKDLRETNYQHLFTPDETICLALSYQGNCSTVRYLRCPAAVTVAHLHKLIRAKYDLTNSHRVDIFYNQDVLSEHLSLIDIAYIYLWRRKRPLELTFRIYENVPPPSKVHVKKEENNPVINNNDWKEVQLRISENGEMSITGIKEEFADSTIVVTKSTSSETKPEVKAVNSNGISLNNALTTTVTACDTLVVSSVASEPSKAFPTKHKLKVDEEPPPKQKILNHTLGLQHLSNNHPLKKHSQAVRTTENGNKVVKWPTTKPCYVPKTTCSPIMTKTTTVSKPPPKSKSNYSIGYKTLRDPPKTWNPQISRPKNTETDQRPLDRPAKFFKMRNNMPRYLGNPASGVKPMYQVHSSPEKTEIKRHSIVKVDPKTLKPISEKAPEAASLSADVKSSPVPIFNPRKTSPKSNLNFTPPNPFVPNLASPTVSPSHFLYPSVGFPSYDPRLVAAYHSLLYGQRGPFSPLMDAQQKALGQQSSSSSSSGSPKAKKSGKEAKSLQDAVEKLTQNRIAKEVDGEAKDKEDVKKDGEENKEVVVTENNQAQN